MSIEVRVPKEITEYKEKIIFNLSIRQLVSFAGAIAIGLIVFFLLSPYMSTEIIGYPIMLICAPFFAVGFIRINGIYFEHFVAIFLRHYFGNKKRFYITEELTPIKIQKTGDKRNVSILKFFSERAKKRRERKRPEYLPERTTENRRINNERIKRNKIRQEIREAKQDFKQVKRKSVAAGSERPANKADKKETVRKGKGKRGKKKN